MVNCVEEVEDLPADEDSAADVNLGEVVEEYDEEIGYCFWG